MTSGLTYRNLMSEALTTFSTRLVKRSEFAAALPADTTKVTPTERQHQMYERFHGHPATLRSLLGEAV